VLAGRWVVLTDIFDTWIAQGYTLTYFESRPAKVSPRCKIQVGDRVTTRDSFQDTGCVMKIYDIATDHVEASMNLAWIQYDGAPGNRDVARECLTLHEDQETPPHIPSDYRAYPVPAGPESDQLHRDRLQWMVDGGANQIRWDLYHPDRPRIWE
jgi:hypothetical protein